MNGDKLLSAKTSNLIKDLDNKCLVSIASIWEIAIKSDLGRLRLKYGFHNIAEFLTSNEIETLPISFAHVQELLKLKHYHRDPFDRIIISQAIYENLIIVTKDDEFGKYKVKFMWN